MRLTDARRARRLSPGLRRGRALPKALQRLDPTRHRQDASPVKTVKLDASGRVYRHVLLWITSLAPKGGAVEVSELSLR